MAHEHRSKSVFPDGFDSSPSDSKGRSSHQNFSPQQLYDVLVDQYSPLTGAELITVQAAWYGKQTTSPRHEFILVEFEDSRDKETHGLSLVNYLVLDRNVQTENRSKFGKISQISSQAREPVDLFRISYDGKIKQFLSDCNLNARRWLGKLEFTSEAPLHLYKLVALARTVSALNPDYYPTGENCYMFAGVIWDILCKLQPSATRDEPLWEERGKNGWYRQIVTESKVEDTYNQALQEISKAEQKIDVQKLGSDTGGDRCRTGSDRRDIYRRVGDLTLKIITADIGLTSLELVNLPC